MCQELYALDFGEWFAICSCLLSRMGLSPLAKQVNGRGELNPRSDKGTGVT